MKTMKKPLKAGTTDVRFYQKICLFVKGLFLILVAPDGYSQTCDVSRAVAQIVSLQGEVYMNEARTQLEHYVCYGDLIEAGPLSRASIRLFSTETVLRIDQGTRFRVLDDTAKESQSLLELLQGILYIFSREPRELDVQTDFGNASIEGTEFLVQATQDYTLITVFEGRILAANNQGELRVSGYQSAIMRPGQRPQLIETIQPEDAVQWALYYRPVLDALYNPAAAPQQLRNALGVVDYRDVPALLAVLDTIPASARDESYYLYRAALLMVVGRVEQAQTEIAQAERLNPANGDAAALKAIIAVTQNDKSSALQQAELAVQQAPQSATAQLALSYTLQAYFDLDGALKAVQNAIANDPDNALAYARLAELWLSSGELDKALQAAQKAVELNPSVARTQTVLGFANLIRIDIPAAITAFNNAIALDQATPLPHLGLGLAQIRNGELAAGREQMAIAVSLDPLNSLFRSYLGKAYYEETRAQLAKPQYDLAKSLDPLDPTPWLYDAIHKQSQNRSIDALQDLQQSIELNDNRAIYRSQLLLDEDEATRGISLARVYQDLGFDQIALVEGSKSLIADSTNYSAHRFLSDAYAQLPRHEIARASELLQAQLLQPVNINPVQPRLGNDQLFFLDDIGFAQVGFNEFTSLFARNQIKLNGSLLTGGNGTLADNVTLSGIHNNLSYSVGQFHFETDGFRENNDFKQDIYNGFVQASISPQTSIQFEARSTEIERGDRFVYFDSDNINLTLNGKADIESYRIGFRHDLSINTSLLATYIHQKSNSFSGFSAGSISTDDASDFAEIRQIYRAKDFNFTSGIGYINSDIDEVRTSSAVNLSLENSFTVSHSNAYVYSSFAYPDNVHWTFGLSFDDFSSAIVSRTQWNPKLGVVWDVTPDTTFRAAAFRTLKRTLATSQTLEPTQLAGFNQFFDDFNATEAWRYGLALDHQFNSAIFAGIELSKRQLTVPRRFGQRTVDFDEDEMLARSYWYWTPSNRLSLSAEYQYEEFEQGGFNFDTHRAPIETRWFHPSGLFSSLRTTYIMQKKIPGENSAAQFSKEKSNFWIVDATVGYRALNSDFMASLEIRNLFDTQFNFQDIDLDDSTINRERVMFFNMAFSF